MTDADLELAELVRQDEELERLERLEARDSLAVYCGLHIPSEIEDEDLRGMEQLPMPARYVPALHHQVLIHYLEALERGYLEAERRTVVCGKVYEKGAKIPFKRLAVFEPPGSAKSTYGSVMFPSWYLGRNPRRCVLQGSYNADLAGRFGRRARNTFATPEHYSVFQVGLGKSAEGEWETDQGGEYFSFGMKTGVTGRRGDLIIIDDAIKGRKEADSKVERENVWQTYIGDVRTRMKPAAAILYIATRWHEDDPAGRILPSEATGKSGWFEAKDGEIWYVLSIQAVIETTEDAENDPLGRKVGEHLWPEWFSAEHFAQERRSQGRRNWSALYQQKPRPDEGAILKREHWRKWPYDKPPKCEYVVSVYDTAFEEGEEDDYTARTSWGIFWHEEEPDPEDLKLPKWKRKPAGGRHCVILLERFKDKVEFPELRKLAKEHYRQFKPDRVLVEKKASGHSLIHELRRNSVPVMPLKADISKLARAHAAAVVLEDGCVWYMDRKWAEEVIEDCATATFQKGSPGNDVGDTCVHAWNFLRRMYHLTTKGEQKEKDEEDDAPPPQPERKGRLF